MLGAVVKHERRVHRWTQTDLATKLGVSQSTMSRIEAGWSEPSAFEYDRLASALGTEIGALDQRLHDIATDVRRAAEAINPKALASAKTRAVAGLITFVIATRS